MYSYWQAYLEEEESNLLLYFICHERPPQRVRNLNVGDFYGKNTLPESTLVINKGSFYYSVDPQIYCCFGRRVQDLGGRGWTIHFHLPSPTQFFFPQKTPKIDIFASLVNIFKKSGVPPKILKISKFFGEKFW